MGPRRSATARCSMPARSATYNGPWTNPDDMRKLNGLLRYSQGTAPTASRSPAWPIATAGIRPTRCRCARSTSGQSVSSARSIRPTAAIPTASRCRAACADRRRRRVEGQCLRRQEHSSTCSTISPSSSPIRSTATSSTSTTTASWPAPTRRARSTGSLGGLPTETTFGIQTRYDDITLGLTNTVQRQFLSNIRTDLVRKAASASMRRAP